MIDSYEVVVKEGLVVRQGKIYRWDIAVKDGKIAAMGANINAKAQKEIDATGKYVLPGIIDVHAHPVYLDDIQATSVTAAHGGITTIIHYAYAKPGNRLLETIKQFREDGERGSVIDFALHGGLFDPEHQSEEIPQAVQAGVTSFKMFMTYAKLKWMTDDYQLMRTLDIIAQAGGMGMVHAENGLATDYLEDKYLQAGRDPKEAFVATRPAILEAEAVNRAIAMAQVAGCPLYIVHLTAREDIEVLKRARNSGYRVFGETCPQYLTLTNDQVFRNGALAKIGPPLRGSDDNQALWEGLAAGVIDTIASDHAPKPKTKDDDFFKAPYGSPSTETMFPVVYDAGVNGGRLTLTRLAQVMSENPARIFGLYPQKGTLQPGSDADLVIIDPTISHTIKQETQHSQATYTLYEGRTCLGKPVLSMQRGKVILENGEVHLPPGEGRFLPTDTQKGTKDFFA
jgi:dihydropyrimidinase